MTKTYLHHYSVTIFLRMKCEHKNLQNNIHFIILIIDINAGCPLNSNQKNDKKMTILFVKNEKKKKKKKKKNKIKKKN